MLRPERLGARSNHFRRLSELEGNWRGSRSSRGSVDVSVCRCSRVSRIEFGHALLPHADEGGGGDGVDVLPGLLDGWKRVAPDGALAPLLAFFLAFVRGAHRLPCKAFRMADVLCGRVNAL